jgi:hypothetical protein
MMKLANFQLFGRSCTWEIKRLRNRSIFVKMISGTISLISEIHITICQDYRFKSSIRVRVGQALPIRHGLQIQPDWKRKSKKSLGGQDHSHRIAQL